MSSKSRSSIWTFFEKTSDLGVVKCKLCEAPVKPCGNTTNIRNHMKQNHASINLDKAFVSKTKVRRTSVSSTQSVASTTSRNSMMSTASTSYSRPQHEDVDDPDDPGDNDFAELAKTIVNKVRY